MPERNLAVSSPVEDFLWLFRRPSQFFDYFRFDHARPLPAWLIFKALAGFLFFSWLAEFLIGSRWVGDFFQNMLKELDPLLDSPLGGQLDIRALRQQFMLMLVTVSQFKIILSPIWALTEVLGFTASTVLFLPLFGVRRSQVSFYSLFVALVYVRWFWVLALIPIVGPTIAPIAIAVLSIYVVKWLTGLSFWKSFVASTVLYWVSVLVIPVLALLFLGLALWAAYT